MGILEDVSKFVEKQKEPVPKHDFAPVTFNEQFRLDTLKFGQVFKPKNLVPKQEYLSFVESFYMMHKCLPNKADFIQKFGSITNQGSFPEDPQEIENLLVEITPGLIARGIPPYETPSDYLEPNFVLAVNLICNVTDKRPPAAKLKEAGLTTKQWKNLLRKPICQEYYTKCVNEIFDEEAQVTAKLTIMRAMENGDLQAVKYFHGMQNIYRENEQSSEQVSTNAQILTILQVIMEILALHVQPEVIGRIATDFRNHEALKALEGVG